MTKTRKLDFSGLMRAIDRRQSGWLTAQPADVSKEFGAAALPAMRMASCGESGTDAAYALWSINQRVNYRMFDLSQKHPDLCYRLLASCGLDRYLSRQWLAPRATSTSNAALKLLAEHHPTASDRELRMLLSFYTRETFAQFVADCGLKDQEYLKAYDKIQRT